MGETLFYYDPRNSFTGGSKSEQDQSQNHIESTRKLCPKIFLVSRSWNLGIYYNDISTKGNYL
jgi:hypothetical protein